MAMAESNAESHKDSAHFRFPYQEAYGIQLDFMRALYATIDAEKIGLFSSPTGTVRAY
jgi:Rad3-related DNA helicase